LIANLIAAALFLSLLLWACVRVVRHTTPHFRRDLAYEFHSGLCSECRGERTALNIDGVEVRCPRCEGTGRAPGPARTG
jgi:hypothetical protein